MLIIVSNIIAVHSTNTGEKLWETKIEKEHLLHKITTAEDIWGSAPGLFITKDIAGYVVKAVEGLDNEKATITIYDTKTGELLCNKMIPMSEAREIEIYDFIAKGPAICYTIDQAVYVYRAQGKQLRKMKFCFPDKCFMGAKKAVRQDNVRGYIELLGFLGKSNILIGSIHGNDDVRLFCLDLDDACATKSQRKEHTYFKIPPSCLVLGSPKNSFKPVYRTDKGTGGVELIGVMRRTKSSSKTLKIDSGIFVTEMQCPSSL